MYRSLCLKVWHVMQLVNHWDCLCKGQPWGACEDDQRSIISLGVFGVVADGVKD